MTTPSQSVKNALGNNSELKRYGKVFLICFFTMMIVFLPVMIYTKGYFIYYGDFNSQQLMFYQHAHDAVRSGVFWDWGTDLGANFVGSYSFYLLGSPFFWLTIPFPSATVPYLIPWLLAIKTGVAGVTSYAFIKRFVASPNAALIGALLYAMSGFQAYNVFFNHFHDVTAFFPLLLIALEERVQNDRKGVFALAVGLMATINYFFFTGQVTFLVIYFLLRCLDKSFNITLKKVISLSIESALGVMLSAVLLLPSVLAIISNPRVDTNLLGLDMVVYNDKNRILRILQSFFMLPDPPARPNLFSSSSARWASIAGYLPLFSMAGVIAFMREKKKHWASKLIWVCLIFAIIPVLNTSFYMFNSSYYARWYYMPILIMAMMTAYAIDNGKVTLKKGVTATAVVAIAFMAVGLLPTEQDGVVVYGKLAKYPDLYYIQLAITVACLFALFYLHGFVKRNGKYYKKALVMTCVCTFICMAGTVWYGVAQGPIVEDYINMGLKGGEEISLPTEEGEFYRIDISKDKDNWPMFWGDYSNMRCFHSVVPGSIMEFYPTIGEERNVASRIDTDVYTLRGMYSVKYYFNATGSELAMTGFKYLESQNGFDIYENECYVPMGYVYDSYFDPERYDGYSKDQKAYLLMSALKLTPEQVEKYDDIMTCFEDFNLVSEHTTIAGYMQDCLDRAEKSCYYFAKDGKGFTAKINLESDELVFFSVPYDDGFTATVNGEPVEVEKVQTGFMAVRVPAGDSEIRFDYETPGLKSGLLITLAGAVLLVGYIVLWKKLVKPEEKAKSDIDYTSFSDEAETAEVAEEDETAEVAVEAETAEIAEKSDEEI